MRRNKSDTIKDADGAKLKAMRLLMYRPRTEKELYDRLLEEGFSEEDTASAMAYVRSFGYLNDESFASGYVAARSREKGKLRLARELSEKGVAREIIEEVLGADEEEEEEKVYRLLLKRAGEPHLPDEKEVRRLSGFFARRGFSTGAFIAALKRYREEYHGEE